MPSRSAAQPAASCPSILLVDDTPANLVALSAVLEQLDVRMVEARSGSEALEHLRREAFAVVLLDVQMRDMDGFETARRIRALPLGREVPIVFLTAIHRDEAYAKRGYASGAADYITKPFDVDVLRARVRAFVDLYRQRELAHRERWELSTRELSEAQRRLAAFERISTAALETDDLAAFLHTLLTVFMSAADSVDTATILLRRGNDLVTVASIGMPEAVQSRVAVPVGTGIAGTIAANGRPTLLVGDVIEGVRTSNEGTGRGRSLYGVPLFHEGEVIGVAHIGFATGDAFEESEKRLFQAMADRAAWVVSRRRSRDLVYAVLDAVPAAMTIWRGPNFVCEYANDAFRSMFPGREIVDETVNQLGATAQIREGFDQVVRTGRSACFEEVAWPQRTPDGRTDERFFRVTLHALRDVTGHPDAVLWVAVDLTPQVRARRELESSERERERLLEREHAAREEAEMANRTKDEFLATVSHELRTPLNAILGWTSSVRRGVVTDVDRALSIIERNARAQARIVEDVLDLSRIVTGKLRLEVVPTELSQAVYGAVEAVRPGAEAKGVTLEGYVDRPLGFVPADADRIQQVVWNLVSNAVKFSARGGRVIVNAANEGERVAIRVRDSGQGIEPGFLPYVFEPFRQADASATRRHGGLGLGLAIVKQLVHAHGGSVRAESEGVGRGSTFIVELPVRAVSDTLRSPSGGADVASSVEGLSKVRVLVVDDEEDSRVLVAQALAQHGAIVDVVDSADAALQRISIAPPDVIVSDIAMAKTDGYSLIRSLRRLPPEAGGTLPAIALTAHARSDDRARAHAAGFQMHLPKPVEMSLLLAGVAELAGLHH